MDHLTYPIYNSSTFNQKERFALIEWLSHISTISSLLYQWKAKSRSGTEMTKDTEAAALQMLTNKLKEIDNRLKFSPFIAGSKVSFADILLSEMLGQMQEILAKLKEEKIVKNLVFVNRVLSYVDGLGLKA